MRLRRPERSFVAFNGAFSPESLAIREAFDLLDTCFALVSLAVVVMCFADRRCGIIFADIATKSTEEVLRQDGFNTFLRTFDCCFNIATNCLGLPVLLLQRLCTEISKNLCRIMSNSHSSLVEVAQLPSCLAGSVGTSRT
jgi:hypothetical protein